MRLFIAFDARYKRGEWGEVRGMFERAWSRIKRFEFERCPEDDTAVPVEEIEIVRDVRSIFNEEFSDRFKPHFEVLIVSDVDICDLKDSSHLILAIIGDNVTGLDNQDSAIDQSQQSAEMHCSACGNLLTVMDEETKIRGDRLPKDKSLFSFARGSALFCRPGFVEAFQKSGMTGLSFVSLPRKSSFGAELYKIIPELHIWKDKSGVCVECYMKTNVRHWQFFNLCEDYRFDFQIARVFTGHVFVVSHRALALLSQVSHTTIHDVRAPIMQGYLIDLVTPENRMFVNGDYPTRVVTY